jgi:hypothetical protein
MSRRDEINQVLKQVQNWTPEDRYELADAILTQDGPPVKPDAPLSVDDLVGIARGSGPAPTDEQVEQWIDEERMRKYGG